MNEFGVERKIVLQSMAFQQLQQQHQQQQHGHKGRKFYFKLVQKMKFCERKEKKEIASKFNQENVFDIGHCVS